MATPTNQAKNSATVTNQDYTGGDRTWDETTTSWDDTPGTWDKGYVSNVTNQVKS
jgi:hypothetical protein